jgi:hypothetical protein
MTQDQDKLREFARKQLKKKQEFKQYLWTYAGVSVLVTGIWFVTSPEGYFWPIWVIFGMGVGAIFTGLDAYGKLSVKPITDADVDAEVERLNRRG